MCAANLVRAAALYGEKDLLKRLSRMLATATELLPTLNPRTANRNDQQYTISKWDGLASMAAAFSVRAGDDVAESLRVLEIGRGLMSSRYFDTRGDLKQLEKSNPDLANRFKHLRDELDPAEVMSQTSLPGYEQNFRDRITKRVQVSKEFEETIEMIRGMEGFDRFLLPPTGEELKYFAVQGPIVFINVALDDRGDAYLITENNIKHLELPELRSEDVTTNSKKLVDALEKNSPKTYCQTNRVILEILRWLWDAAVESILYTLGFTKVPPKDKEWPHIWWIPISSMSLFPIHAAGNYSVPGQSVLDRVISSYTTTIRGLDHARKHVAKLSTKSTQKLLIASMPTTPHQNDLQFVEQEVNTILSIIPPSIQIKNLECPTKQEVESELVDCSLVHFACHGVVGSNPSESGILLSDWQRSLFSIADAARINLDKAEFAYLSACHAANNRNLELLDESLHMTGAFQLAGFPTVIGTLWQVDDWFSAKIAEYVYKEMLIKDRLDVGKAAWALHVAVRKVRNESKSPKGELDPMAWVPYIHVGV